MFSYFSSKMSCKSPKYNTHFAQMYIYAISFLLTQEEKMPNSYSNISDFFEIIHSYFLPTHVLSSIYTSSVLRSHYKLTFTLFSRD